jgi:hypothetical protein
MAIDLIDLAKRQLTPDVVDKLSAFTGETTPATSKALTGSVPTVLAGMLQSASAPGGLTRLIDLFGQGRHDGSMLSALTGQLGGGSDLDGLISSGGSILGSLFGTRQEAVTGVIASTSGVRQSSAGSLFSIAAPMVLGLIGKQLSSSGGVTMSSLKDLLLGQRNAIAASAPPGLASALGLRDLGSLGGNLAQEAAVVPPAVGEPSRPRSWTPLLVGVAAVVALFLLIPLLRGPGRRASVTTDTLSTAARTAIPSTASLTEILTTKLGLSARQASGGLGSILTYAQSKLSPGDFGQLSATIPGADQAIQVAKDAGAVTGPITDKNGLSAAYAHLGISPEVGQKLNATVIDYAGKAGGPQVGRILGGLLQ